MDPFRNSLAYVIAKLNGVTMPGKVVISGLSDKRKWDIAAASGDDGATIKGGGASELAKFKMQIQMWEPWQFDDFEANVRPLLAKSKGKQTTALEIEHPECAKLDVRRVVVEEISQLIVVNEEGLFAYEVDFLQYAPAKPKAFLKAKGDDTPGGGPEKKPEKELTEKQKMIVQLTKQLKEEAAK